MTRIKVIAIPKNKEQTPRINPFSNPFADKPAMAYGGRLENDTAHGNSRLDTKWDWMRLPLQDYGYRPSPYANTNRTLPEAEPGQGDINAEKQEQVMGDFNGDGMPVLMNVDGPPHTQGGKDVSVPDNSFVFSDTKSLTIKDKDTLAQFGGKKPSTPADLAKKYNLQKYKAIMDNPDADDLDKSTAQKMYTNYVDKLNALASVQEQMKAKKGVPNDLQGKRYGGYQDGGNYRFDLNADPSVNAYQQWQMANKPRSVAMATQLMGLPAAGRYDDNLYGPRTKMVEAMNERALPGEYIAPLDTISPVSMDTQGAGSFTPYPMTNPYDQEDSGKTKGKGRSFQPPAGGFITPDMTRDFLLGLRAASYPKYSPVRQVAHAAVAQPVFLDPTRAKAAVTEQANRAADIAGMSATGPVARANALYASGMAGARAADIEGQYATQNASIANQSNQQAAQTYNQLWQQQQGYNKEYNEEVANQLKDRYGFTTAMANEYLKGLYEDRDRRIKQAWLNKTSPYFGVTNQGMPFFKSADAQAKFMQTINGGQGYSTGSADRANQIYQELIKQPIYQTEEGKKAALATAERMAGLREHERLAYGPYGIPKGSTESGVYSGPMKYGGSTKKRVRITGLPK